MKIVGALLLACLLATARAEETIDEKDVAVLSQSNFTDVLGKHKYALVRWKSEHHHRPPKRLMRSLSPEFVLMHEFCDLQVEFYAPWCGHCKVCWHLGCAPHLWSLLCRRCKRLLTYFCCNFCAVQALKGPYAEAATALKEVDPQIVLAKVDATEEKDLAEKYEVKGYPTIKWFVDGEVAMDYSGGRSGSEIIAWIKKKTGPVSVVLDSADALDKAKKDEISVYGYFEKLEGDEHAAFEALAAKTDDAVFNKITDAALAKSLGLTKAPSFAVGRAYPDFDFEVVTSDGHDALKGDDSLEKKLGAFLAAEKLPAFLEFSPATSGRIFGSGVTKQVIIVATPESFEKGADLRKAIEEASGATRGQVVWVTGKTDSAAADPIINYFGLNKESKEPQMVGFHADGGKKFAFPADTKVDGKSLIAFAKAVVDGTADRMTKSAEIPAEPYEDNVRVVVGKNFEEIVMDPTKDVLLEVYAPWCGHCKQLAPIYSKLGKRFKDIDSVVIAKMDGTENEHPAVEAKGYPTILFFPAAKDAEAIPYNGGRDLKSMTKFIKENAKTSYELPKKADKKEGDETEEDEEKEEGHDEL